MWQLTAPRVGFGLEPDSSIAATAPLFNNLIGASERRARHGDAEQPCSLEVDDKLELAQLLRRKIGRLLHWLGGRVKSRSPASSRLSAAARCLSRHLRMKALRPAAIASCVAE